MTVQFCLSPLMKMKMTRGSQASPVLLWNNELTVCVWLNINCCFINDDLHDFISLQRADVGSQHSNTPLIKHMEAFPLCNFTSSCFLLMGFNQAHSDTRCKDQALLFKVSVSLCCDRWSFTSDHWLIDWSIDTLWHMTGITNTLSSSYLLSDIWSPT